MGKREPIKGNKLMNGIQMVQQMPLMENSRQGIYFFLPPANAAKMNAIPLNAKAWNTLVISLPFPA